MCNNNCLIPIKACGQRHPGDRSNSKTRVGEEQKNTLLWSWQIGFDFRHLRQKQKKNRRDLVYSQEQLVSSTYGPSQSVFLTADQWSRSDPYSHSAEGGHYLHQHAESFVQRQQLRACDVNNNTH